MSILIVDDSRLMRAMLVAVLGAAGHQNVVGVDSAAAAFAHLGLGSPTRDVEGQNKEGAGGEVDLVLMDLTMPEVDGIAAIRRIRAEPSLDDLPVIVVTGRSEREDLKAAFDAGASDYITKPPDEVELLARVSSALKLKRAIDGRKARERELIRLKHELEAANALLSRLSLTDDLTGLANRRHLDATLASEWQSAARDGHSLSLVLVDVDCFKRYNDTYGHQQGDACLRAVAGALADQLRRPRDLVARYGGEEFAVVLPGVSAEGALEVAEGLRARVEALGLAHAASSAASMVTVSLGLAAARPGRGSSPAGLVAAADGALYAAKAGGRNRVSAASDPVPA